ANRLSLLTIPTTPRATLFPYTTLFRSGRFDGAERRIALADEQFRTRSSAGLPARQKFRRQRQVGAQPLGLRSRAGAGLGAFSARSEEHTSELQSRFDLVCRLLLEKKQE